ncbi:OmpA family protein [Halomonas sp. YLGW01]|uniref:OmpA/MotB family protein n=1 Tax=Halomonas sp. YLGW01 TaxID=2773308 RepID=UPI001786B89B|nr:OmpA family protein [Halomonas sp. YLGW01]
MPDHRRLRQRREQVLAPDSQDDGSGIWMLSYIDIMTLLVALFALLLSVTATSDREEDVANEELLTPEALVVALGVAGGMPGASAMPGPRVDVSGPLALQAALEAPPMPSVLLAERLDLESLEEVSILVTEAAPDRARRLDPQALAAADTLGQALAEQLEVAPLLPSLEDVEVSRVEEGINLRIQDRLAFESADAALTPQGQAMVERLVELVARYDGTVSVEGHTDDRDIATPRYPSNWELSTARATAILRELQAAGIEASRLRAIGYADTRPLADNTSAEGRAANRRVEVIVHL